MANGWKEISGYDGYYEVSNSGEVRSYKNGRWGKRDTPKTLKPGITTKGYKFIVLANDGKNEIKRIHRLVAEYFIPNPKNKPCVNHLDGDKLNNNVSNLEWVTYSENAIHAQDNNLNSPPPKNDHRGEKCHNSKLTKEDVLEIRAAWPLGCFTQREMADAYGVGADQISRILNHKRWAHI